MGMESEDMVGRSDEIDTRVIAKSNWMDEVMCLSRRGTAIGEQLEWTESRNLLATNITIPNG